MNIAQNICEAIDIIVNRAIEQATFAKTIVAQVLECVDAAAGLYKVKYQESIYQATCDNLELQYKKGTDVYVLIPKEFGGGHLVEHCYDGYGHFGGEE